MNSFQFMFNCLIADIMTPPLLTNIILIIAFGGCILKKHFFIFLYFYNDLTVIFFSLSPLSLSLSLSLFIFIFILSNKVFKIEWNALSRKSKNNLQIK